MLFIFQEKKVNVVKFTQVLFYFIDASEKSYSFEMVVKKRKYHFSACQINLLLHAAVQVKLCMWEKL